MTHMGVPAITSAHAVVRSSATTTPRRLMTAYEVFGSIKECTGGVVVPNHLKIGPQLNNYVKQACRNRRETH